MAILSPSLAGSNNGNSRGSGPRNRGSSPCPAVLTRCPGGSRSSADRRLIAVDVGELLLHPRHVDPVGEHPPRLAEVLRALDAERAGDLAVLQVPDQELA